MMWRNLSALLFGFACVSCSAQFQQPKSSSVPKVSRRTTPDPVATSGVLLHDRRKIAVTDAVYIRDKELKALRDDTYHFVTDDANADLDASEFLPHWHKWQELYNERRFCGPIGQQSVACHLTTLAVMSDAYSAAASYADQCPLDGLVHKFDKYLLGGREVIAKLVAQPDGPRLVRLAVRVKGAASGWVKLKFVPSAVVDDEQPFELIVELSKREREMPVYLSIGTWVVEVRNLAGEAVDTAPQPIALAVSSRGTPRHVITINSAVPEAASAAAAKCPLE